MASPVLHLDLNAETPCALSSETLEKTLEAVLKDQNIAATCYVSLTCTDENTMRKLNKTWRGVDSPTDVLSLECERPQDAIESPVVLGDIILCPSYIEHQAEEFHTTPQKETQMLAVHGMLHLLGYDHMCEKDATRMEKVQRRILEGLKEEA